MLKIIIKVVDVVTENIADFWNFIDIVIFFYRESRRDRKSQKKQKNSRPPPEIKIYL